VHGRKALRLVIQGSDIYRYLEAARPYAARRQRESVMTRVQPKRYFFKEIDSPVGRLKLVGSDRGLAAILWKNENPRWVRLGHVVPEEHHPVLLKTEHQLREYFAGRRKRFDLDLDFTGTPFQGRVWQALLTIPYGETRTYTEIARQIDAPTATRAVGAANGRNPISIVVPCHRVLGSTGKLTGFAGGLEAKAYLLTLEAPQRNLHLRVYPQPASLR
jgi:methylated-DNA-[protein]-cysteine S-methyltransferase